MAKPTSVATMRYMNEKYRQFVLALGDTPENQAMIDWIRSHKSVNGYLTGLIRADIGSGEPLVDPHDDGRTPEQRLAEVKAAVKKLKDSGKTPYMLYVAKETGISYYRIHETPELRELCVVRGENPSAGD